MRLRYLILVVLSMALMPLVALAQDCIDYEEYLRWLARYDEYERTRCVEIVGDRAYIVATDGVNQLVILDVSEPTRPAFLGSVALPGSAGDTVLAIGEMVYVASWNGGLQIVDVSDPLAPSIVGAFPTESYAEDVATAAGVVLVSEMDQSTVHVVDVSDPSSPGEIAVVTVGGEVRELAAAGDHAYLLEYDFPGSAYLHVIDLADPVEPVLASSFEIGDYARGLDVAGGFAYLIVRPDLVVVDVRDPSEPILVGSVELPDHKSDVHAAGDLVFIGSDFDGNVSVVDVSSPTMPLYLAEIPLIGTLMGMDSADHRLFTVTWNFGLNVIDITVPLNAPPMHQMAFEGGRKMTMVDRKIYAGTVDGLRIIDATVPQDAMVLGGIDLSGGVSGPPILIGDLAYVIAGEAGCDVIDVSDPQDPTIVGRWDAPGDPEHLARSGAYLLVTLDMGFHQAPVLEILSLANPHAPETIGSLALPEEAEKVYGGHDHAYFGVGGYSGWNGMMVVDLTIPEDPQIVGEVEIPGAFFVGQIIVDDGIAYVFAGSAGLVSIDVGDPTKPVLLDVVLTPGGVAGMAAVGNDLYFDSARGLRVADVTDPTAMQVIGTGFVGGYPRDVVADEGMVAVLEGESGLHFFYPHCDGTVPVMVASFSARVEAGAVHLAWEISNPAPDLEFRLRAIQGGHQWPVDVQADGSGEYHAVDRSPRRDPHHPVRYDLYFCEAGGLEYLVASETVDGVVAAPGVHLVGASPNPFNPRTAIAYSLDTEGPVCLEVFDTRGRLVATLVDGIEAAGSHSVDWDGRDATGHAVASGVYIYRLDAGGRLAHGRMTLVR